jgi:hypothetical protein
MAWPDPERFQARTETRIRARRSRIRSVYLDDFACGIERHRFPAALQASHLKL